jgi:hypothetical protein
MGSTPKRSPPKNRRSDPAPSAARRRAKAPCTAPKTERAGSANTPAASSSNATSAESGGPSASTNHCPSTESVLLQRIFAGELRLIDGQHVEYYHRRRRRWYRKVPHQHPKSGRWRFAFGENHCRSPVYRNRLIWMLVHRAAIPIGCFVDHEDGNRLNDHPDNLKLVTAGESHQQGNGIQAYNRSREVCHFFDFIALYGREPADSELGDDSLFF